VEKNKTASLYTTEWLFTRKKFGRISSKREIDGAALVLDLFTIDPLRTDPFRTDPFRADP
jgi:hypothetical protein